MGEERLKGLLEESSTTEIDEQQKEGDFKEECKMNGLDWLGGLNGTVPNKPGNDHI